MSIKHIETLMFNPIFFSKIIQSFITGYNKEVDLKTIFYVLPIVMYKDARIRLNSVRCDSTLYSIFDREKKFDEYGVEFNSKFCLNQIAGLFNDYATFTKQSIIILSSQNKINLHKNIILQESFNYRKTPEKIREYFKAAHCLGMILTKIGLIEFEDFLEIKLEA
jgi:hypothetical protein